MTANKNPKIVPLTKANNRWKWMARATAVVAAATPHTQAQTAQISLINNQLDSVSGNNLTLDITDGNLFGSVYYAVRNALEARATLRINAKRNSLTAFFSNSEHLFYAHVNGSVNVAHYGVGIQRAYGLVPFTLTDPNVAGGQANTDALLEVEAFNQSSSDQTVSLLAVFYPESGNTTPSLTINNATGAITGSYTNVGSSNDGVYTAAVPEPACSSLALLALGAGGILARRRLKKAA